MMLTAFHTQFFAQELTKKHSAVFAHELAHVFIHEKYQHLSDVTLTEGLATWAAGDYWKAWKGMDFDAGVRTFIAGRTYLSLVQNYDLAKAYDDQSPTCLADRDTLLTELSSWIDYLIQNYGMAPLTVLLDGRQPEIINNQRAVYPPSFQGVYGLELNQLEYEWLKTLLS